MVLLCAIPAMMSLKKMHDVIALYSGDCVARGAVGFVLKTCGDAALLDKMSM